MDKKLFLGIVFLCLLIISSCKPTTPVIEDHHVGKQGLVLEFTDNTPPKEVYEQDDIPLSLKLWNKGAFDVPLQDVYFNIKGDNLFVNVIEDDIFKIIDDSSDAYNKSALKIFYGKSYYYPEGEGSWLYPVLRTKKIIGTREQPSTQLFAEVCYPYKTEFAETICVDVNPYDEDKREQVCTAEPLSFQDQGAPLAITKINNVPRSVHRTEAGGSGYVNLVQPSFEITISNLGDGIVVTDNFNLENGGLTSACQMDIPQSSINKFKIEAFLGTKALTCTPSNPYLRGNEVIVNCLLPIEDVNYVSTSYFDELQVNLYYIYKNSVSADFEIKRRLDHLQAEDFTYNYQDKHQAYINGVQRCEYCSGSPNSNECSDWQSLVKQGKVIKNKDYSCSCTEKDCPLDSTTCIRGNTLCASGNICCTK